MKLNVWSPLPPAPSGIADYTAETLTELGRRVELALVVEDPAAVSQDSVPVGAKLVTPEAAPAADLDLYHVGNSPAHGYVYRRAVREPGVVVLHDWCLHHLLLHETVERGDTSAYLHEMRREYGERGTFVARQVARGLGGELLPARFPLNDRLLEASVAIVALSGALARRARGVRPDRRVLHLPHHLSLPGEPLPSRAEARQRLGLPADAFLVTAPGLATRSKRLGPLALAVARLRSRRLEHDSELRLVVAGAVEPELSLPKDPGLIVTGRLSISDFVLHLVAADVVSALRFPSHGEMSGALVRALGVGRPCLVTAGTPPAEEFPEGLTVHVGPGRDETAHLESVLEMLLREPETRAEIARLAAAHVRTRHGLVATVDSLVGFLEQARGDRERLAAAWRRQQAPRGGLLEFFSEEVHWSAQELGLRRYPLDLPELLGGLSGQGSRAVASVRGE